MATRKKLCPQQRCTFKTSFTLTSECRKKPIGSGVVGSHRGFHEPIPNTCEMIEHMASDTAALHGRVDRRLPYEERLRVLRARESGDETTDSDVGSGHYRRRREVPTPQHVKIGSVDVQRSRFAGDTPKFLAIFESWRLKFHIYDSGPFPGSLQRQATNTNHSPFMGCPPSHMAG